MRYPEGHKEEVRARIVAEAARALRREGLGAVSIPALMKRAGLTHGGFYVHFKNRNELLAEAVLAAARATGEGVSLKKGADLSSTLRRYLSKDHVKHPEVGCVLAALGTEGIKQAGPVRRSFAKAARGFLALLDAKTQKPAGADAPNDEALLLASRMIGAVVLARLVDDEQLAERILSAARRG